MRCRTHHLPKGLSITELVVVLAVIGVLAGIAIPTYKDINQKSRVAVARDVMEALNGAVHRFNQTNYELLLAADPSTQDELSVLRTIQYRDPQNPKPGSPYMRRDWNPVPSADPRDHRLVWTGSLFKLVEPGAAGSGLKVDFNGADLGAPYQFPAGFTMAGS